MEMKNYSQLLNKFVCESCDYSTYKKSDFVKHTTTRKHLKNSLDIYGNQEVFATILHYSCSQCNYTTNIKSNYDKHLLSEKHKKKCLIVNEGEPKETKHICSQCNKEYLNNSGLWKHKKHCIPVHNEREPTELQNVFTPNNDISQNSVSVTDIFLEVLHHFSIKMPIII
jgi:hypothetical protein